MVINNFIRLNVRKRAKYLCEYCHSPERSNATPFTIDHIIPQSLGGSDDLNNLALACHRCNQRRYNFTSGIDPETQTEVSLFNPRYHKKIPLLLLLIIFQLEKLLSMLLLQEELLQVVLNFQIQYLSLNLN